jgi:hypothetical protein
MLAAFGKPPAAEKLRLKALLIHLVVVVQTASSNTNPVRGTRLFFIFSEVLLTPPMKNKKRPWPRPGCFPGKKARPDLSYSTGANRHFVPIAGH